VPDEAQGSSQAKDTVCAAGEQFDWSIRSGRPAARKHYCTVPAHAVELQSIGGCEMVNRSNYLWVKAHLNYLSEVAQLKANSVARYWFYLRHLLLWADEVPFSRVPDIRPTFPSYLASVRPRGETGTFAPATLKKIVNTAKRFFLWVKATYPREFRGLPKRWIDTLRPPRSVEPPPNHEFVTLDEALQLAALKIEENNLALRRDQAGAALLYVSGMRAGALGSLPLEAVDVSGRTIKQWPSLGVRTKNGKTASGTHSYGRACHPPLCGTHRLSAVGASRRFRPTRLGLIEMSPLPGGCASSSPPLACRTNHPTSSATVMLFMPCSTHKRWPTTKPSV